MKKHRLLIPTFVVGLLACLPAISTQAQGTPNSDSSTPATVATASAPVPLSANHSLNIVPSVTDSSANGGSNGASAPSSDWGHRFEFAGEYAYLSNGVGSEGTETSNFEGDGRQGIHGYGAQFTYYFNKNVGFGIDVSGNNGTSPFFGENQREDQYYYIFGPVVSHRIGNVRINGHFGAGITNQHIGFACSECEEDGFKEVDFAAQVGGSMDWLSSGGFWGIRIIKLDYLYSVFKGDPVHNVRVETGFIFRFK